MTKRIAFFHQEFPSGGTERVTMDIAEYVARHNCEVYVFARLVKNDVPHLTIIQLPDKKDNDSRENADFILSKFNELHIDVFVLPIYVLRSLEHILEHTSCKLIFSLHNKPLWESSSRLYGKKKRSKGSLLKMLIWYGITYPKEKLLRQYDRRFLKQYERVYGLADAFTVLCQEFKDELVEKMHLPPADNKIVVMPNTEKTVEHPRLEKKKQILFVGTLSYEHKRVDRLIDIWGMIYRQAPDWELMLVGDGAERKMFEEQAAKMKLERIRFVGHSDHPQEYYQDAAIICLTSTFEGWGLCLTEGQANGVIPVVFDSYAAAHHIVGPSGVNGFLVPPFDKKEYARVLLKLMNDPSMQKEMQQNVIRKAKEYAPEVVGKKWLQLFDVC